MQIQMTETQQGSPDAHIVKRYHKACVYDVPDTLACRFIKEGWARSTDELSCAAAYERLMMEIANQKLAKQMGFI